MVRRSVVGFERSSSVYRVLYGMIRFDGSSHRRRISDMGRHAARGVVVPAGAKGWLSSSAPGPIRTADLSLRRRALYPLSYGRRSPSLRAFLHHAASALTLSRA